MYLFKHFDLSSTLLLGLFGQLLFSARFCVQWIQSERRKESFIPFSFWILSFLGGIILLVYAILKKDLVFILGQSFGLIVYGRNIVLIRRTTQLNSFK
jgi:lipid-A-disaccharide synthase-like uncharacterized protein